MATTYYCSDEASDLSVPGDTFDKKLVAGTPVGSAFWNITLSNGAPPNNNYAYTEPGVPGADGSTGNYDVITRFSTFDVDMGLTVQLHRINSSGTVQSSSSVSSEVDCSVDRTISFSSLNLGTWASGDRLRVDYNLVENQAHGNSSTVAVVGTAFCRVNTPWTITGPSGPPAGSLATMGIGK